MASGVCRAGSGGIGISTSIFTVGVAYGYYYSDSIKNKNRKIATTYAGSKYTNVCTETLQGSTDNSSWTDLYTCTTAATTVKETDVSAYKYLRAKLNYLASDRPTDGYCFMTIVI